MPADVINIRQSFNRRLMVIALMAVVLALLFLFAGYPQLVERFYSEGFYIFLCHILHPVFNIFPFSIGDLLYVITITYMTYQAVRFISDLIRKRFIRCAISLMAFVTGIQAAIITFYVFWGLNYYRPPAAKLLTLDTGNFTTEQLKKVTALLIDSANNLRSRLTVKDLKTPDDSVYNIAIKAINKLSRGPVIFRIYMPDIKPSVLTPLLNYMSTSGFYNPFTGEAQINYNVPSFNKPVTACHEIAHQMGFALEDEANFVGFLTCIHSGNNFFKYSAYQLAVGEFMHTLYQRDSVANKALKLKISAAVHRDFKYERDYWMYYENKAGVLTGIFYNGFLKANNQPRGLDTYNDMVLLIMGLYKKNGPAF